MKKVRDENLVLNIIVNGDQGKREIGELERVITDTRTAIKKLEQEQRKLEKQGKTNTSRYNENKAALEQYGHHITQAQEQLSALRKGLKLTEMSIADLTKRQQQLSRLRNMSAPNTEQWKRYGTELREVSARLVELKGKSTSTGFSFCKAADGVNKYIGLITTGIATFATAITGIKKATDAFAEYDEKLADVMKTTGLTKEQTILLSESLAKINTRTAQNELLDLARIGGKLGLSGEQDLLGFVRAADKIKVALAEDLGGDAEEAVSKIGKLVDLFKIKDEFGIEQAMLKTGSAINSLGAASTANEEFIVQFTSRMGGVGKAAGISIQNVLGFAATLDALAVRSEIGSTAISRVIMGMFEKTSTYAQVAGKELSEFKYLLENDVNSALIATLEGMGKGGMETVIKELDAVGINGTEAATVLSALTGNIEMLRKQQEISNESFAQGNSLQEEFNTKNSTAKAEMEKRMKVLTQLSVELGEKLIPAVNASTSVFSFFVKTLTVLVDFASKYKGVVLATTAALVTYVVVGKQKALVDQLESINIKNLTFARIKNNFLIAAEKVGVKAVTVAILLYNAATCLLTKNVTGATAAVKQLNLVTKTTPLGWLATAVGVVVGVMYWLATRTSDAARATKALNDIQKEATESASEEASNLQYLLTVAENKNVSDERRLQAIKELQGLMPGGIDLINQETIATGKAREAVDNYIKSLLLRYKIEAAEKKLKAIAQADFEAEMNGEKKKLGFWQNVSVGLGQLYFEKYDILINKIKVFQTKNEKTYNESIKNQIESITRMSDAWRAELEKINTDTLNATGSGGGVEDNIFDKNWSLTSDLQYKARKKMLDSEETDAAVHNKKLLALEIERLNARIAAEKDSEDVLADYRDQIAQKKKALATGTPSPGGGTPAGGNRKSTVETKEMEQKVILAKAFYNGQITSEREYQQQLLLLEIAGLEQRLERETLTKNEQIEMTQQLLDKKIKLQKSEIDQQQNLQKALFEISADGYAKERLRYEDKLREFEIFGKADYQLTQDQLQMKYQLTLAHQTNLNTLEANGIEEAVKARRKLYEDQLTLLKSQNANELKAVTTLEQAKLLLADSLSQQELRKITTLEQAKQALTKRYSFQEQALVKQQFEELSAIMDEMLSTGAFDGIVLGVDLEISEQERQQLLTQINAWKEKYAKEVGAPPETTTEKADPKFNILGMDQDQWSVFNRPESDPAKPFDKTVVAIRAMSAAYGMYSDLVSASERRQLQKFRKDNDEKKRRLKQRLDVGSISQENYNAQIVKMDEELDRKQQEIELKQARRAKAQAVVDTIVNTAVAVSEALPNIPLSVIVEALGAAQLATILSQPLVGYQQGGLVQREQDGKVFDARYEPSLRGFVNRPTILVGESGPEYVIPTEAMDNPTVQPFLSALESARLKGTLRSVDLSAVGIRPLRGYTEGGYLDRKSPTEPHALPTPEPSLDPSLMIQLLAALSKLDKRLDQPLEAQVTLFGRKGLLAQQKKLGEIQNNSNIG